MLNYRFREFMGQRYNNEINERFKKERYPKLNVGIRNNFYALDDFGIPIRSNEQDRKTAYGWCIFDNNEKRYIVHYLTPLNMIGRYTNDEIKRLTLQNIKTKYPNEFVKRGRFSMI